MKRLLMASLVLCSFVASAQQQKPAPQKTQEVKFDEDELIDGTLETPDVPLVRVHERVVFDSLVRIRTSFAEKVMASEAELP